MRRDAYVAIRQSRTRVHGQPLRDGVILVDLAAAGDLEALRNVDPAVLHKEGSPILLRAEPDDEDREEFLDLARSMFARWDLPHGITLLEHPVGEPPRLEHLHGPTIAEEDRGRLLRHARLVELHALLEWGQAIWRPQSYHYLLPSGEHAAEYIRLADAIREPRDAEVLASWLNRSLVDRMGFVIDTGVLNPVVLALIRNLEGHGWRANPVAVLDQYPRSSADVDAAFDVAAGKEGNVLALLSISSSGAVLDRLYTSLERKRSTLNVARLEILIRKTDAPLPAEVEVWSPIEGETAMVSEGTTDATCDLCRSQQRARICPISPRTLDEMLPSQLRMTSPSVAGALAAKDYWEIADATDAVRVEAHPHPAIGFHRPQKISMPIAVRLEEVLKCPDLPGAIAKRLRVLANEGLRTDPDLVLVPRHELELPGYRDFWAGIGDALAPAHQDGLLGYPVDGSPVDAEAAEKIRSARSVLVFCLGSVSGVLLQRGLLVAQSARADGRYGLQGFVLHARPASAREWEGLTNAYGVDEADHSQLFFGWRTLLPDRSPLHEELALLQGLDESELDREMLDFRQERIQLCGGGSGDRRPPLFWGSREDDRLTPNAIFGERLTPRSAYAAVGAAMEEARAPRAEDASPEYRVFELPAIFRSYYDPLLVGSILRWLRPHEAWWGWQWSDSERAVSHLVNRMPLDLRRIVVAELLLAAAQGKLGPAAIPHLRAFAEDLVPSLDGDERAAVRLGLHIAPKPDPITAIKG